MKQILAFLVILGGVGLLLARQSDEPLHIRSASQAASVATASDELVIGGEVVGKRVPSKPGDICMLCNRPVDADDTVYMVNGQRVALHDAERQAASPETLRNLIASLRPRGAFLGADPGQPQTSKAWFYFGAYIFVGLLFSALCAHRALVTGQDPIPWMLAGLALNVVAYAALLTRPKREMAAPAGVPKGLKKISSTYMPEACPKCGTENHPTAAACAGCGAKLSPTRVSEVARVGAAH